MWKHTVWPKLPPNKWEKDQPSKHDDALITVLWDQLVGLSAFKLLLCFITMLGRLLLSEKMPLYLHADVFLALLQMTHVNVCRQKWITSLPCCGGWMCMAMCCTALPMLEHH